MAMRPHCDSCGNTIQGPNYGEVDLEHKLNDIHIIVQASKILIQAGPEQNKEIIDKADLCERCLAEAMYSWSAPRVKKNGVVR